MVAGCFFMIVHGMTSWNEPSDARISPGGDERSLSSACPLGDSPMNVVGHDECSP
jgi:hypothetical protein